MNPLALEARLPPQAAARPAPRAVRWVALNIAALTIVAVLLRTWHLGTVPGVNGDEAWSGAQALRLLHGESITWRTPTGNPLNVFYFLPLVALHALFAPSFIVLRIVPLVSGLLALAVNFVFCRRVFDLRTAVVFTLMLAFLPVDIAYSRFAWDASQSLLAVSLVMWAALIQAHAQSRASQLPSAWSMLALAAAILVHPTNLFAAPLLCVPLLFNARDRIVGNAVQAARRVGRWPRIAIAALGMGAAVVIAGFAQGFLDRLHGPREFGQFALNYLELFSGATIYRFVSGAAFPLPSIEWLDLLATSNVIFGAFALASLIGLKRRLTREPGELDSMLAWSWFAMLAGFVVVAGSQAIAPHFERYGICLIAPGSLVLARGLTYWIEPWRLTSRRVVMALSVSVWLWPASFYAGYFYFVKQTGGESHFTFRTAEVEPKQAAFDFVLEHTQPSRQAQIVCSQWWNYWPLEYLALGQPNVRVVNEEQWQEANARSSKARDEGTWFVEYAGSQAEREALAACARAQKNVERRVISDYAGRPLLSVIGPAENFSQNY